MKNRKPQHLRFNRKALNPEETPKESKTREIIKGFAPQPLKKVFGLRHSLKKTGKWTRPFDSGSIDAIKIAEAITLKHGGIGPRFPITGSGPREPEKGTGPRRPRRGTGTGPRRPRRGTGPRRPRRGTGPR